MTLEPTWRGSQWIYKFTGIQKKQTSEAMLEDVKEPSYFQNQQRKKIVYFAIPKWIVL